MLSQSAVGYPSAVRLGDTEKEAELDDTLKDLGLRPIQEFVPDYDRKKAPEGLLPSLPTPALVRQAISDALKGVPKPPFTDTHKANLSASFMANGSHRGANNAMFGIEREFTEEHRERISAANSGQKNGMSGHKLVWYTDGIKSLRLPIGAEPPANFTPGRPGWSKKCR